MRGIIVGTSLMDSEMFKEAKKELVKTEYGDVPLVKVRDTYVLNRHHSDKPPHSINWKANIAALKKVGIDEVIGISSVGSLKREIEPGSFVIPSDHINFRPLTFFDDKIVHITLHIDDVLRKELISVAKELELNVHNGGIHWQTSGPRLETAAECKYIAQFADVVGMTMENEATLTQELGMRFAGICTIDNYANGIVEKPVSYEGIREQARKNIHNTERIVKRLVR